MSDPELTPWFPANVRPARKGWYDIRSWGRADIPLGDDMRMAWWNGKAWRYTPWWSLPCELDASDCWRGLAKAPA